MSQAFISYHHAQRKLARLIAHRVAADGHSVWWDRSDRPGDEWSEAVSSALARSACVVVLWSKQAAAAPAILGEATAGYGRNALINVMADKTAPPPPFHNAPTIDLQDWTGDSIDVAWIRLRDPIRAKMQAAEVKHVEGQALPPHRPPPQIAPPRPSFQAPLNLPPPAPIYEERRSSGGAGSALMVLALAGIAAGGWYYRDELRQEASRWQAALEPQREVAAIPEAPAAPVAVPMQPPPLLPVDAAALVEPLAPELVEAPPVAETKTAAAAVAARTPANAPASASSPSFEDSWVPPPVIRQLPRAAPPADPPFADDTPVAQPVVVVQQIPASPAVQRIDLRQGRFVDIDSADPRRQTDIWFAPDKSGDGLYLGVANGARMRTVPLARATDAECGRSGAIMRRTPIAARELARGIGVCVRTSTNRLRVVHVEGIEGSGQTKVLRLRLSPVAGS